MFVELADLDFGIYRIMNQKRDQVMDFVDRKLPKDIKDILSQTQSKDSASIQADLDQMGKSLDDAGVARESAPKYLALKAQLENTIDTNALEQEVFSHLASFFKRYYKDGDFISLRRYKKDVYAIPYEGEEVKLHWANHDQYYIKTSEYLKNYAFKLSDGKKVYFQLKEASTEQNNNKTQGDSERRFAIFEEQPFEVVDGELFINFTYQQHKKTVKQDELAKQALDIIQNNIPAEFVLAFDKAPTEKNKNRTLVEKHLNDFISRNSFDYFIHKDLGGFLSRELDFYIKNEVLYIDDINTENPAYFTAQLSKIKALKLVASKIINFLAQIENFQKKLWLKKKFVISTNYCITLDRIPAKYYPEIASNETQLTEWKELFSFTLSGVEALKNEPFLVVDTKFFPEEFKDRLLAEFDNLDEETNGLLINSENFQALNLMQEKYQDKINGIYIDPPYNTNATEIVYKNEFKDSSWCSLIENRVSLAKSLLSENAITCTTIDECEVDNLSLILKATYSNYTIRPTIIEYNHRGRVKSNFAITHEYGLWAIPEGKDLITKKREISDDIRRNLRRTGTDSLRTDVPKQFYGIEVDKETLRIVSVHRSLDVDEEIPIHDNQNTIVIYPIDDDGIQRRWYYGRDRVEIEANDTVWAKIIKGKYHIHYHQDGKAKMRKSVWVGNLMDSSTHGTELLNDIFGMGSRDFSFPKSIYAVKDSLDSISDNPSSMYLDYFSGSGTTGHATIKLNREDGGNRKYILVEMGTYFNTVTKPRIQKVIYTDNWKNGQPQDKEGISQLFKYQVLESYEDALNNLFIASKVQDGLFQFSEEAQEEYLLNYMLDVETQDHLFNIQMFRNPFNYQLKVTENNELVPTKVDLVETFNYLIGLYVERIQRVGDIKFVEGKTREGVKTLIIWRNLETTSNEETEKRFRKIYDSVRSSEFDQIYINGDHHFDNMRTGEDTFKVKLIEETFFKQMFNISEL
ncbi:MULTISPECIES: DNA methyltransferase, partial [unclassified Empedobacter]|uniref:DNA methyltransferase n=1 Tax=unclassified Empedobacter TaxID=2643773 RepID=UPI0025BBD453